MTPFASREASTVQRIMRRFFLSVGVVAGLVVLVLVTVERVNVQMVALALIEEESKVHAEHLMLAGQLTADDFTLSHTPDRARVAFERLAQGLEQTNIPKVRLLDRDGVIVWSSDGTGVGQVTDNLVAARQALAGRTRALASQVTAFPAWQTDFQVYLPARVDGQIVGAFEMYPRRPEVVRLGRVMAKRLATAFVATLAAVLAIMYWSVHASALGVARQEAELQSAQGELRLNAFEALNTLVAALEARDRYTEGHSRRVAEYATRMGRALGLAGEDLQLLHEAALIHDIGKIGVRDSILHKPGRLTEEEWAEIQNHPALGAEIVAPYHAFTPHRAVVMHHHERWDGRGYPGGLAGTDIPLFARIVAVADTFDALTSARPYRPAHTPEAALEIIGQVAGTQLDPDIARLVASGRIVLGSDSDMRVGRKID